MVEDNRDPFEFDDDPLAGAEDLELPSTFETELNPLDAYRDSSESFAPPTTPSIDPGLPIPGGAFDVPTASPPPSSGPPPSAPPGSFSPPPEPQPFAPVEPPGSFAQPGATPPSASFADFPPPAGSAAEPPSSFPPGSQPPPGAPAPAYGAPPSYGQGYSPGVAPPIKKSSKGCLFWGVIISLIFALLIGGCIAAGVLIGQSASDAANSFLDAVEDADYAGAAAQSNQACGLSADQIEADLGGMTDHFILAIGPIASGEVEFGSRTESIVMELTDDLVCTYELLEQ